MCYTGNCKYENHMGDCTVVSQLKYPDDAGCAINEHDEPKPCKNFINGDCRHGRESCELSFKICCVDCDYDDNNCNKNRECGDRTEVIASEM